MNIDTRIPSKSPDGAAAGWPRIDTRDLRRALGAFATGVTVVSSLDPQDKPVGFTANSFTSVSLDPPLVLVCLAKGARSFPVFSCADFFAINILAEGQRELSNVFATVGADKFARSSWRRETTGAPVLEGVSAWLDCRAHAQIDAGDHVVLIGRVVAYAHSARPPLGYCNGTYINLAMTAALDAAVDDQALRVGAIVESAGKVLFREEPEKGTLSLPTARRMGRPEDRDGLLALLAGVGLEARPSFIYSVFESGASQAVYYRAAIAGCGGLRDPAYGFLPLDDGTLARVADPAVRSMLERFRGERARDLFGIYVGTHEAGDVRPLGKGDPL